jgi:hypothetical protein
MAKALFLEDLPIIGKYVRDLLANKVDKVEGKNLSTNDYTTEEKTKLETLSSDYDDLTDKPSINGVTLTGNKTTEDLIPIGDGLEFNEDGELEATGGSDVLVIEAVIYNETSELYSIKFGKSLTEIVSDIEGVNGNAIVKIWTTSAKSKCYLSETFNDDGSGNWVTNVRRYSNDIVCRDVLIIGNSSDNRKSVWKYPLQKNLTFDSTPTQNSSNPVTSGGIYNALQNAGGTTDYTDLENQPQINGVTLTGNKTSADLGLMNHYDVDERPTEDSENLISSKAVWEADEEIKDKLQGSKTAGSTDGSPFEIPDYGMTESIAMYFKPTQDLHGYDKPWAGGAGKNKFGLPYKGTSGTNVGITATVNSDSSVRFQGTSQGEYYWSFKIDDVTLQLDAGTYTISSKNDIPQGVTIFIQNSSTYINAFNKSRTLTFSEPTNLICYAYIPQTGNNIDFTAELQLEEGNQATTFEPYSNICPISGQNNATFEWTGKNKIDDEYSEEYTNTVKLGAGTYYYQGFVSDTSNVNTRLQYSKDGTNWNTVGSTPYSDTGISVTGWDGGWSASGTYAATIETTSSLYFRVWKVNEVLENRRLSISDTELTVYARYIYDELPMNFGKTCYGGFCTFDGQVYSTWSYIASYNGETLSGEWVSDRDEYTARTTPTIGAEVAYENTQSTDYFRVTPPANLNLTDDYPIEYNGYMASISYQPKGTVLAEAKKYTNQEIAKLGLPQLPTIDGTYHLECSVSSGIPTITWVSNS